jgi:hypothetical protein
VPQGAAMTNFSFLSPHHIAVACERNLPLIHHQHHHRKDNKGMLLFADGDDYSIFKKISVLSQQRRKMRPRILNV